MSTKRMLLTVLAAGTVVLALVFGSQLAGGSAQARPPVQQPVPPGTRPEPSRGVTIPYPGRLTDAAGQPVPDGAYDFTFTLYAAETGGAALWSEVQQSVVVQGGAFHVQLGSVQSIPQAALNGGERWLAVAVRGPGEADFTALAPRQQVSAAVSAPDSASAGLACPHDHLGESWVGDSGASIDGLYVKNTKAGGTGVCGKSDTGDGVVGETGGANKSGVYAVHTGSGGTGYGVFARGTIGVKGSGSYRGVIGEATAATSTGVEGTATGANGTAVSGVANVGGMARGVYGESSSGFAGVFNGNVDIWGNLTKTSGGFKIDHPLDPANKYLYHSFVESPDMKNVYDGVVTLDANGEAVVKLPEWFGALNRDFRYQLTCIGGFAPVYIAEEIRDNQFKIAGGSPGLKVSWQVTGIRQDPYAEQHRIPIEEDKSLEERGTYIYPEGYGLPDTMGLDVKHQQLKEGQ